MAMNILKCSRCGLTVLGAVTKSPQAKASPKNWHCANCSGKKQGTEGARFPSGKSRRP
jgi:hypothetical protein